MGTPDTRRPQLAASAPQALVGRIMTAPEAKARPEALQPGPLYIRLAGTREDICRIVYRRPYWAEDR
jgi:hypothetical protein